MAPISTRLVPAPCLHAPSRGGERAAGCRHEGSRLFLACPARLCDSFTIPSLLPGQWRAFAMRPPCFGVRGGLLAPDSDLLLRLPGRYSRRHVPRLLVVSTFEEEFLERVSVFFLALETATFVWRLLFILGLFPRPG